MMSNRLVPLRFVAATATAALVAATSFPAEAGKKDAFGVLGAAVVGAAILGGIAKSIPNVQAAPERQRPSSGGSGSGSSSKKRDGEGTASRKTTPTPVQASSAKSAAELYALREIDRVEREDRQRNVDRQIKVFIVDLHNGHVRRRADQNRTEEAVKLTSEVSEADIRRTLDEAYTVEQLAQFEQFEGEPWARDRILVRVLQEATGEIEPFFKGVGARGPNAGDVAQIMIKAAKKVYVQIFEVSELLGLASSHERMYRDIAERPGSSEQTDRLLTVVSGPTFDRAVAEALIPIQQRRIDNNDSYALRLRARRALYDCVATAALDPEAGAPKTDGQPEVRADAPPSVQRASTGQPGQPSAGATIVEDLAGGDDATTAPSEQTVLASLTRTCHGRLARLMTTRVMPIPARAMLDSQTRPNVDGQLWQISLPSNKQ